MGTWNELSNELAQATQAIGKTVIAVQAASGRTVSGIILDEQTVITTARAIVDQDKIRVWISPEKPFDASLVGSDFGTDIALLKSEAKLSDVAAFSENPKLAVGQFVLALGRTWRGNLVASSPNS